MFSDLLARTADRIPRGMALVSDYLSRHIARVRNQLAVFWDQNRHHVMSSAEAAVSLEKRIATRYMCTNIHDVCGRRRSILAAKTQTLELNHRLSLTEFPHSTMHCS